MEKTIACETVDILGATAKEKWKNAIFLYSIAIEGNVVEVNRRLEEASGGDDGTSELVEMLNASMRVLGEFRAEMNRLVEGVFA